MPKRKWQAMSPVAASVSNGSYLNFYRMSIGCRGCRCHIVAPFTMALPARISGGTLLIAACHEESSRQRRALAVGAERFSVSSYRGRQKNPFRLPESICRRQRSAKKQRKWSVAGFGTGVKGFSHGNYILQNGTGISGPAGAPNEVPVKPDCARPAHITIR
jgi:hypothetical protein